MHDPIKMVPCSYCNTEWIQDDAELVCEKCTECLELDMAVLDISTAITLLENSSTEKFQERMNLLKRSHQKLGNIIAKHTVDTQ